MIPERYSRQVLVDGVGEAGQEAIANSKVVIIGLGALGSNVANLLARAGVGELYLVDRDFVDWTNLHRQVLYDEEDARKTIPKAIAAKKHLERINSEISYQVIVTDVNSSNIEEIVTGATLVVDGLDNLPTRALINEACVKHGIPWIHGTCIATYGCLATFIPGKTACFHCVYPDVTERTAVSDTCDTAGVLGPTASMVASWEASEALRLIVGKQKNEVATGLIFIELWEKSVQSIPIEQNPDCKVCGKRHFTLLEQPQQVFATSLCGRQAVQVVPPVSFQIDFDNLAHGLGKIFRIEQNQYLLKFYPGEYEVVLFRDGRAIIFGTTDVQTARNIYGRYIGG
ncbi:MAG: ThiF family adenylyltransferase [Thermoactinomyces sp.]